MELYLSRCLNSILLEEIKDDIEVIVINDGSHDQSSYIAHSYLPSFNESLIIIDKENGGYGSTINTGIRIANGKYFKVCDSDDWFDKNEFISFVKDLKCLDADLIYNKYSKEYVLQNKSISIDSPIIGEYKYNTIYNIDEVSLVRLLCLPEITYKTQLLKDLGINLNEKSLYTDLQYVTFPISGIKSIIITQYNIYRYFIGRIDQSISQQSKEKNITQLEQIAKSLITYNNETFLTPQKRNLVESTIAETYATILCTYLLGFYNNRRQALLTLKDRKEYIYHNYSHIYKLILRGNLLPNKLIKLYDRLPFCGYLLPYIYRMYKLLNNMISKI